MGSVGMPPPVMSPLSPFHSFPRVHELTFGGLCAVICCRKPHGVMEAKEGGMLMRSTDSITNEMAAAIIADKCRADQDFFRCMQADCKTALSSLSGVSLTDDLNVSVVRNAPGRVHVVLPDYESQKDVQRSHLSDEQMAQVSGGEILITILAVGVVGAAIVGSGIAAAVVTEEQKRQHRRG